MQERLIAAKEKKDRPFVFLVQRLPGCPDRKIVKAIAVHVPGTGHRGTEEGILLIPDQGPGRVCLQAIARAKEQKGRTLFVDPIVVSWGADEQVIKAIAVHVPGTGHGSTKERPRLSAACLPIRDGPQASRTAKEQEGGPLRYNLRPVVRRAHDHVAVAIAVHVAGMAHSVTNFIAGLIAPIEPIGQQS